MYSYKPLELGIKKNNKRNTGSRSYRVYLLVEMTYHRCLIRKYLFRALYFYIYIYTYIYVCIYIHTYIKHIGASLMAQQVKDPPANAGETGDVASTPG